MNMEKRIISRTIGYLVVKDIFLLILICGHILTYYHVMWQINIVIVSILLVGALFWILFFTNLFRTVLIAKKDKYLVKAFGDEYFSNIKIKAGYNGYIMMILFCLVFIIVSIVLNTLSIQVDIPIYISCEILFLLGVVTDDVSKILLSKG